MSPTLSDLSDEVIVFTGRGRSRKGQSNALSVGKEPIRSDQSRIGNFADNRQERKLLPTVTAGTSRKNSISAQQVHIGEITGPLLVGEQSLEIISRQPKPELAASREPTHGSSSKQHLGRSCRSQLENKTKEQASINDYVANVRGEDSGLESSFNQRDLGEVGYDEFLGMITYGADQKMTFIGPRDPWEHCDLDTSTSNDLSGPPQRLLSKREIRTGLQYLAAWENHGMYEARWILKSSLTDPTSLRLIEAFEAQNAPVKRSHGGEDNGSSNSSKHASGNQDIGDSDPEEWIADQTTDRKIVPCLAKQNELDIWPVVGMLNDNSTDTDDDGDESNENKDMALTDLPIQQPYSKGMYCARGSKYEFPNATALADAYDSFDIMDFNRSSLKKIRGRKGMPIFDVYDSELEESMNAALREDRLKKKKRKEERESLRARSLLGSKGNKEDIQGRRKGMTIHTAKEELKRFLISGDAT